jgi:phosphohistidine phosphatase SixA
VRLPIILVAFAATMLTPLSAAADTPLWDLLRTGGQVILMRHAQTTPGVGDPPGFRIDNCATQRNLSAHGRDDARRLGDALRGRGIRVGEVLTSRWCRAIDTARLAFGRYTVWDSLNSTFHDRSAQHAQTEAVRQRIAAFRGPDTLVLVGHGANIVALTGIHPRQGGMVVVTPDGADGFRVAGQIDPDTLLSGAATLR